MDQYIGFNLNNTEYTLPIIKVREIINIPEITRMPQSLPYIEGVANLRGSIIPVVNIKKLVNLDDDGRPGSKVIIVASGSISFGIVVDGITGVINIEDSAIEPSDRILNNNAGQVKGVAKLKDRLVVLLDTMKLIPCDDISAFEDIIVDIKNTDNGDKVEVTKKIHTIAGESNIKEVCDAKEFLEKRGISAKDTKFLLFDDMVSFIDAISNQDYQKADNAIENILKKGQGDLFNEVGRVTRKLHDSVRSFKDALDPRIKDMANLEVPDAIDRLNFVIEKTEDAANKTMGIVEKHLMQMDELSANIRRLNGPDDAVNFLKNYKNDLEDDLSELITTQSFQDLTGQTIKKVIRLVGDLEEELVRMITTFGLKAESSAASDNTAHEKVSQTDVDDLLKEFGF